MWASPITIGAESDKVLTTGQEAYSLRAAYRRSPTSLMRERLCRC